MPVKTIEVLKKGLGILELFTIARPCLKLQEITAETGIPKATVYRLLQTLISLDYLKYQPAAALYHLGPRVMALGFTVLSSLDIGESALPYLQELSRVTDQNVNLGILDGSEIVYITRLKRRRILNIDLAVGSRLGAHETAIGRAVLAYLDETHLQQVIEQLLQDPVKARLIGRRGKLLRQDLAQVRRQGFALNDEDLVPGLRSVGAPVFNGKGQVEAGINIPVFSQMCSLEELTEKMVPLLLATAQKISQVRGYQQGMPNSGQLPQSPGSTS